MRLITFFAAVLTLVLFAYVAAFAAGLLGWRWHS
jgi:hypothetical protein